MPPPGRRSSGFCRDRVQWLSETPGWPSESRGLVYVLHPEGRGREHFRGPPPAPSARGLALESAGADRAAAWRGLNVPERWMDRESPPRSIRERPGLTFSEPGRSWRAEKVS